MADLTTQLVTGRWTYVVADGFGLVDGDREPDEVGATGIVYFSAEIGSNPALPAGSPIRSVSLGIHRGLVVNGELQDLSGASGIRLVTRIGSHPVYWTAKPALAWKGSPIAADTVRFGPTADAEIHLNSVLNPGAYPALGDALIRQIVGEWLEDLGDDRYPRLVDGKLAVSALPDLAIIDYLGTASSQAQMLTLGGQKGDWCIRTDTATTWVITGSNPAQIGSWTQMPMASSSATPPDDSITKAKLAPTVRTSIDRADTSLQPTASKPNGDTKVGLIDWSQDGTVGYAVHITLGPNSGATVAGIAIGTDNGAGSGLIVSHKNSGRGIDIGVQPGAGTGLQITGRSALGFPARVMMKAGSLPVSLRADTGAAFADGVTNAGSTTFTSATAAFTAADVGKTLTQTTSKGASQPIGTIPAGATIQSVTDAQTVVLSAAATVSATGLLFEVGGRAVPSSQALLSVQGEDAATYTTLSKQGVLARGSDPAVPPMRVRRRASQTAAIQDWADESGNVLSLIGPSGHLMTKVKAAPSTAELGASTMALSLDDTSGAPKLVVTAKDSAGALATLAMPIGAVAAGNDGRFKTFEANVGTGAAGPYTVTHNLGTRSLIPIVYRNAQPGIPAEIVDVRVTMTPTTATVDPDEVWGTDAFHLVLLGVVGTSDVSAPAKPTLASGTITSTTIAVTASSSDNVGVVYYSWYRDGTYVRTTDTATFVYGSGDQASNAPLTPSQSYTLACITTDRAGNDSPVSDGLVRSTTAQAAVSFDAASAGSRTAGANATSWSHTVGTGPNRILVVAVMTSQNGWVQTAGATASVTSDKDGALTALGAGVDIGVSGQEQGSVRLFYKLNPTSGAHNLTASVAISGTTNDQTAATSASYANVGSITDRTVASYASSDGVAKSGVSLTVPSATGDFDVAAIAVADGPAAVTNRTDRASLGAAVNGRGDYLTQSDATGASSPVAFTTSTTYLAYAALGARLVKA